MDKDEIVFVTRGIVVEDIVRTLSHARARELSSNGPIVEVTIRIEREKIGEIQQILFTLSKQQFPNESVFPKFQTKQNYDLPKRLAVFDMDSTLIQQEVIDEIADFAGIKKEIAAITELAMNGELNFEQSFRRRVHLLKGLDQDVFDRVRQRITFTPGAKELCTALKSAGYYLIVASGGFLPLANYVQSYLNLDEAHANQACPSLVIR